MDFAALLAETRSRNAGNEMLRATDEEIEEVKSYFNWQAPDLTITFLQKVYSEKVVSHAHHVWDVHTDRDRWWVITNPNNLYSQDQFPNMDLALTFHIGLCLRTPRSEEQQLKDLRVLPFGAVFAQMEETEAALSQAADVAGYQAVGMRCREVLLTLIGVAQDVTIWESPAVQRANFKGWSEIIANEMLAGDKNKERRRALKSAMEEAWVFANWLTHAKSAVWMDAELAKSMTSHAMGICVSYFMRRLRDVPDACPQCQSPRLEPQYGNSETSPDTLFEWPHCADCDWEGKPVTVAQLNGFEGLVTGEGERSDEHSVMAAPFRTIKRP
jgi:hypothetical protein